MEETTCNAGLWNPPSFCEGVGPGWLVVEGWWAGHVWSWNNEQLEPGSDHFHVRSLPALKSSRLQLPYSIRFPRHGASDFLQRYAKGSKGLIRHFSGLHTDNFSNTFRKNILPTIEVNMPRCPKPPPSCLWSTTRRNSWAQKRRSWLDEKIVQVMQSANTARSY